VLSSFTALWRRNDFSYVLKVFRRKLAEIKEAYGRYRRVKGDGNCFIRGYIFAAFEHLINAKNATETHGIAGRIAGYYFQMIDKKHGLGYSAGAIEDFHDEVRGVVDAIAKGTMGVDMLETDINSPNLSNSLVFFCRLLCSCHIQTRSLQYAPFLGIDVEGEGPRGERAVRAKVREYCLREVEPLEKEVG
jgi:ubiquitin thioesterase protein OTUB1